VSAAASETIAMGDAELRELRRGLEGLALRASRLLSTRAQARLELTLARVEQATVGELADRLEPLDRSVVVDFGAELPPAFVLLSRTLAFALLALRFGARPGTLGAAAPERPYTRIEERALERTAAELWEALRAGGGATLSRPARVAGLEDSAQLRERENAIIWLACFAVAGLEQEEHLLLAIPRALDLVEGPEPPAQGSALAR
jgi:flagellar motor switch protein FliM